MLYKRCPFYLSDIYDYDDVRLPVLTTLYKRPFHLSDIFYTYIIYILYITKLDSLVKEELIRYHPELCFMQFFNIDFNLGLIIVPKCDKYP